MKYEGSGKFRQRADQPAFRTAAPSVASFPIGSFSEESRNILSSSGWQPPQASRLPD